MQCNLYELFSYQNMNYLYMPINQQLKTAIESIKFSSKLRQAEIAEQLGVKSTYLSDMINGRVPFSDNMKEKLYEVFSYNTDNSMLHGKRMYFGGEDYKENDNLIPFYDDVSSIVDGVSQPTEYIDAGDWFKDATAAIRHYGDSMVEYPPGCILALKEVIDRKLIIPGRDYCIETSEYRVTKRIQKGSDKDHWAAYSTNPAIYADGRLIHEPFDIPMRAIRRIFLVLGYVVKKNGGSMVFSNKGK